MISRRFDILEAAVREFIETGEPISSSFLYEKYDFGIRPAMIRAELSRLSDEGYLEQPYHSAGRIPSNLGFEFYADKALKAEDPNPIPSLQDLLFECHFEDLLRHLSHDLGVAGAIGSANGTFMKEGLDALMENMSWGPREDMLQVIRDFESLDQRLSRLEKAFNDNFLDVFIGKKSPVTKSDELAVMAGDYETEEGKVFLFAIGPKRMDYEKAAALLKGLKAFQVQNEQ